MRRIRKPKPVFPVLRSKSPPTAARRPLLVSSVEVACAIEELAFKRAYSSVEIQTVVGAFAIAAGFLGATLTIGLAVGLGVGRATTTGLETIILSVPLTSRSYTLPLLMRARTGIEYVPSGVHGATVSKV